MGTIECSQPASKSSLDSQDLRDISMVLKMAHFRKSTGPRWVNVTFPNQTRIWVFPYQEVIFLLFCQFSTIIKTLDSTSISHLWLMGVTTVHLQ